MRTAWVVAWAVAWVIGLCGVVWATLQAGFVLSNDGPQHLLGAMASLAAPDAPFAHVAALNEPMTGRGVPALMAVFEPLLGWSDGYRAVLVTCVALYAFGFLALVAAVDVQRLPVALLGCATAQHVPFALGVLPFCLAQGLALFAVAFGLADGASPATRPAARALRVTLLGALLFATARLHALPAILAGLALVVDALALPVPWAQRRARLGALLLAGLPAAAVAIAASAMVGELAARRADPVWWPLAARLFTTFLTSRPDGAILLVVALVSAAAALRIGHRRDRALAATGLALVAGAWLVPRDFLGWELASVRFAPMGTLLLLASAPLDRLWTTRPRAWLALGVFFGGLAALLLAHSADRAIRQRNACAGALALLSTQQPDPRLVSQVVLLPTCGLDLEVPNLTPAIHLSSLYAVPRRTLGEFAQASSPTNHPIRGAPERYRGLAFVPPALWQDAASMTGAERHERLTLLARDLRSRPLLLLYAPPADIAVFAGLGWVAEQASPELFLGHFEGCSLDVSGARPVVVTAVDSSVRWSTDAQPAGGVSGAPCGRVRVQAGEEDCGELVLVRGHTASLPCDHR